MLKDKYKIYSFFYESNKISVHDIGCELSFWIDHYTGLQDGTPNKLDDVPIVIVAHSMGGLVSRAFMQYATYQNGNFSGQPGGNRVIRLITLATPHHGSIAANGLTTADCLNYQTQTWYQPLILLGFFKWVSWNWELSTYVDTLEPNRNDLLWDNFNNSIDLCPAYFWE